MDKDLVTKSWRPCCAEIMSRLSSMTAETPVSCQPGIEDGTC